MGSVFHLEILLRQMLCISHIYHLIPHNCTWVKSPAVLSALSLLIFSFFFEVLSGLAVFLFHSFIVPFATEEQNHTCASGVGRLK